MTKESAHMTHSTSSSYARLYIMAGIHFVLMFGLMYAMVDIFSNVFVNVNQFYMAGLMTAPMVVLEVLLMSSMYKQKIINGIILGASVVVALVCFLLIRQQTFVSDRQFLRSMIPHHGGAILMCQKASLQDTEIKELCQQILVSQQAEIDQMKALLDKTK